MLHRHDFSDLAAIVPDGLAPFSAPALAIIVPAHNESGNVEPLIAALDRALPGIVWEAIFVDDASTDGTAERITAIARTRPDIRLIHRPERRGLTSAVLDGILATTAPAVAVIDADMQHDETILPRLLAPIEAGADIAIGTRYAAYGSTGSWAPEQARLSALVTRLATRLLGLEVSDPVSSFFIVRRETVLAALPHLAGSGSRLLIGLLTAAREPLCIVEVPYRARILAAEASRRDTLVALDYVLLLADKLFGRLIPLRLIMFLAVATAAFTVDRVVLMLAVDAADLALRGAQTVAVATSILFGFMLNNLLTFRDRCLKGRDWWRGLVSFSLISGVGAIVQLGLSEHVHDGRSVWWVGAAGALIGTVWAYAASSFLTWRPRPRPPRRAKREREQPSTTA